MVLFLHTHTDNSKTEHCNRNYDRDASLLGMKMTLAITCHDIVVVNILK